MITARQLQALGKNLREGWFYLSAPFCQLPDLCGALHKPPGSQRIARQQFRTLVTQTQHNVVAASCGFALMAVCFWVFNPGVGVAIWIVLSLASMVLMAVLVHRFIRTSPTDDTLRRWEVWISALTVLAGIQWGVPIFLLGENATSHATEVAAGSLIAIAGSLSLHVRYRPSIYWMALPCGVLISVGLVSVGELVPVAVGVGFFIAVLLLVRLTLLQNELMTQTLHNSEERLVLLQELELRQHEVQQANQAKTRFLAAASHDLRQPIHSIVLLTSALARRPGADVDVHEQISASVQAMDDMLNGLLEVSKLDIASVPLNVGPVSLETLLNRLQLQFRAQAQEKEVALVVQTKAHHLHTDPDQLYRLLANLVSNAVRFTHRGRVLVRTRVRGPWLWIQVWDSGVGVARQDRQRIFEEFVRLSTSKEASLHGRSTGLGLSIVQRVAQRLGCHLVVRSRLGAGSMFAVRLPLERRSEGRTTSTDTSLEELLSGLLVLLIEDDPAARRSMHTLLQYCGSHVLAAQSTEDALAVVDKTLRTPDLIVSDFRLGDRDTGLDAIAQVRAAVGEPIPALLMTAERTAPHDAAARIGVPVLSKPVRATDLVEALTRLRG